MLNATQNRLAAIAFRWSITALCALWVFAPSASAQQAQAAKSASVDGVYNGTYGNEKDPTKFKLSLTQKDNGTVTGEFTLYVTDGSDTKEYTSDLTGVYLAANRMVQVFNGKWKIAPPGGVNIRGMAGVFDPAGHNGDGQISGDMLVPRRGPKFEAIRDADESAKLASATADKKDAEAPVTPVAPRGRRPAAANRTAPAPSSATPASPAPQPDTSSPTAINGVYTGTYEVAGEVGVGGNFKTKLSLKSTADGSLTGLFTFDLPPSAGSRPATYKLTGKYTAGKRWPFQFLTIEPLGKPAPDSYTPKTLEACFGQGPLVAGRNGMEYSLNTDHISGPMSGPAAVAFAAVRDKAESANLDKVMEAQAAAALAPASTAPAPLVRRAFEGIYNGSYTGKQGPTKFKLTLWMVQENLTLEGQVVNTEIAGLLALYLPEGSTTKAYTSELKGSYSPNGNFQLLSKRWDADPPANLHIAGLTGRFDPDTAGNGAKHISGYMSDPSNSKFQAIQDATESAAMDLAHLRSNLRPGIPGVFNGTYTQAKGPPTKFKLTITRIPGYLAGMATIYLPTDSGTKACTYSLRGSDNPDGHGFSLAVHDWETIPPKDYEYRELKGMAFNCTLVLDLARNTARIISAQNHDKDAIPTFEATWDAKESSDIEGTLAAQKKVDAVELAAALKERDQAIRSAQPKQLASKDLVRKSQKYWGSYETDMIREVFDGGFGAGIDEDSLFQQLFCTYVELYSTKYAALLPPDHQTVTITRSTRKPDGNGGYINVPQSTSTVQVDSRFAAKYRQFAEGLGSSRRGMGTAIAAMASGASPRAMVNNLLAPLHDMQRFFANHPANSAAMHQLTENFLRGINGDPSLQQADGKIDGAQAETDNDLPPGRYARFVDGANAYYRDRAKADPNRFAGSSSHDTAFCQCLAELYDAGNMSRDEEYYYANDFEGRFLHIMAPRAHCPDPAWPRLNPAVNQAIEQVR